MTFKPKIVPLGDSALLVQLGDEIDITTNQTVHRLAALIHLSPLDGVIETVPAYSTLLIHYDPLSLRYTEILEWVEMKLEQLDAATVRKPREIEVPVRYGGEVGVDLQLVADSHQLRAEDVNRNILIE